MAWSIAAAMPWCMAMDSLPSTKIGAQPQPLVEKAAQRRTVGVEMIEDGEFQHASFSGDEGMNWR